MFCNRLAVETWVDGQGHPAATSARDENDERDCRVAAGYLDHAAMLLKSLPDSDERQRAIETDLCLAAETIFPDLRGEVAGMSFGRIDDRGDAWVDPSVATG